MSEHQTVHPADIPTAHDLVEARTPGAFFDQDSNGGGQYLINGEVVAILMQETSGQYVLRFTKQLNG